VSRELEAKKEEGMNDASCLHVGGGGGGGVRSRKNRHKRTINPISKTDSSIVCIYDDDDAALASFSISAESTLTISHQSPLGLLLTHMKFFASLFMLLLLLHHAGTGCCRRLKCNCKVVFDWVLFFFREFEL